MTSLDTLDARVRSAAFRLRLQRAIDAFVVAAAGALALASVALATSWFAESRLPFETWIGLALLPVTAAFAAALRRVPLLPLVVALDRRHALPDLLSSAWSFLQLPAAKQTAFMRATVARAERAAASVSPEPIRRPRRLGLLAFAGAAALAAWQGLPPPPSAAHTIAVVPAPALRERLVSAAELEAYRERLAELALDAEVAPRAAALRDELERVVDELSRGPADRMQVLRRLRALEARTRVLAAAPGSARESAERAAAEWNDNTPAESSPAAAAEPPLAPDAPPAPAKDAPPAAPRHRQSPAAPEPSASEQPDSPGAPSPSATPPGRGEPSPAELPRGPMPQPSAAARSNDAREGPRGEVERASEQEGSRALADAISELRDLLRRGQSLPGDPRDQPGGSRQPERDPNASDLPDRDDSRADRTGSPNAAYASQGPPPIEGGDGEGQKASDVPQLEAAPTRVRGATGDGPIRSQVIYGAAERGFGGRDYEKVHRDYERHAERELEHEAIPPGYRGYVRRYFQSIAPRQSP
jgi:hypothetical protein